MKNNKKKRAHFLEILRLSYNLRYMVVLNISKLLIPSFYENWMKPKLQTPAPCRPMINYVKMNMPQNLVGVEVGVYAGSNAFSILNNLRLKQLYLIDPYVPYSDGEEAIYTVYPENTFALAKARLKHFPNVKWIKEKSVKAVFKIKDPLDFVYIDANHSYNHVKADIAAFYPLIRKGGVLGGHDFNTQFLEVIKAVSEFAVANDLDLFVEQSDWWVIKKESPTMEELKND